jgi:hypothetical protein
MPPVVGRRRVPWWSVASWASRTGRPEPCDSIDGLVGPVVSPRFVAFDTYEPYVLRCSTSATGGSRHFFHRHQPAARPWFCDTSQIPIFA